MKPIYQHDCEACTFLGTWTGNQTHFEGTTGGEGTWDLYFCGTHTRGSVICRYGDEGSEYCSSSISRTSPSLIDLYPYKECYDRAVKKGLFCNDISNAYMPSYEIREVVVACDMVVDALCKLEYLQSDQYDMVLREFSRLGDNVDEDEHQLRQVYSALYKYVMHHKMEQEEFKRRS